MSGLFQVVACTAGAVPEEVAAIVGASQSTRVAGTRQSSPSIVEEARHPTMVKMGMSWTTSHPDSRSLQLQDQEHRGLWAQGSLQVACVCREEKLGADWTRIT